MHMLFDRDFDLEREQEREVALAEQASSQGPTTAEIEEMIARAREEGRAEGDATGYARAMTDAAGEREAQLGKVFQDLSIDLNKLLSGMTKERDGIQSDMTSLLATICEKAMPELLEQFGPKAAVDEIGKVVTRARGSHWLEIRVNPEHQSDVREILGQLRDPEQENRSIRIIPDESYDLTTVTAFWHNGRSSYSLAKICDKIMSTLFGANGAPSQKPETADGEQE